MNIFDSHAHLQDNRIFSSCTALLERAEICGVRRILCCGSNEQDWGVVAGLYEKYPDRIIPAFGIHPFYVHGLSDHWLETLIGLLDQYPGAAVGEIGLDKWIKDWDYQQQLDIFRKQMDYAVLYNRPVSIHCRNAWQDLHTVISDTGVPACGGAVHSWSGSAEMVHVMIKHNLSISFSGSVTNDNNRKGIRALLEVPAEMLLIESDAPDLPPSQRKFPNEPSYIVDTIKKIAELRMVTDTDLAEQTFKNASRIFCTMDMDT
jgi:TatD DNase family protein